MSMSNVPAEDAVPEGVEPGGTGDMTDPDEYGGLSVEGDPPGTVAPRGLAGGAGETHEDGR